MTTFKLPCEVFWRLSKATIKGSHEYDNLNVVRIENHEGHSFAVATNARILACQYLGVTNDPDGGANIIVTEELVKQCKIEKAFDSELFVTITEIPGVGNFGSVNTTFGFNYPHNAVQFPPPEGWGKPWHGWRYIVPDQMPKKAVGHMFMDGAWISALAGAAPSGRIVFPTVIDTNIPVLVRDAIDPDWFGLFIAVVPIGQTTKPATKPDWI